LQKKVSFTEFIPILIILFVCFFVYFNALFGDFVYDDVMQIVGNPWILDIRNIPTIFSKDVWAFNPGTAGMVSNYYRPLMYATFVLNYQLFGLKPWGFHLVNILFHCGASVLVFLIIRRLLSEQRAPGSPSYFSPPFIAAVLFASHPIHTEAVTWISGLPDVAFTFFYLLAFYLYVRSDTVLSGNYLFSIGCFAVAALFKEPALTLPVVLLAYDYTCRKKRTSLTDSAKRYIPYLLIGAGYLVLRIHALGEFAPMKGHVKLSAYQYAINVFPLFIQYLAKLLFPLNLNAFYVFHPITSLFELKGALSLVATVVFVVLFPVTLKKNRVAFLGLVLMTMPLLPVLYIPGIVGENTFADRYLYLPSVGYVLLLAIFLSWAEKKLPRAVKSITILFLVLGGVYAVGTVSRNNIWKDNLTLWKDTVRKSPGSAVVHNNLAFAYGSSSQRDRAIAEYQTAVRLKPDYVEGHFNLGVVYASLGQWDKAIAEYQTVIQVNPAFIAAHYNLGIIYASLGQWDKAISEYQATLRLNPDHSDAHNNLGVAYASLGQWDKAIAEYQAALRLNPDLADTHCNLGIAYASLGQWEEATAEYETALRLNPDFYEARRRLNDMILRRR
jgi:tetratricopeptide (TPR) repeat protein